MSRSSRQKFLEANNPNYDSRTGLGYGTDGGRFAPWKNATTFPYAKPPLNDIDDEEEYDDEDDVELQNAIANKSGSGHYPWDQWLRGVDRFSFAGAATNIGKMQEQTTGRSLSPIPNLYKNKEGVLGVGADGPSIRPAPARVSLAGSKAGYSSALPLRDLGGSEPAYTLEEIPAGDDLTMTRLRRLIRAIHLQQSDAND
jgi:hypothetical protein